LQSKGWIVAVSHIRQLGEGAEGAAPEGIFTKAVGVQRAATAAAFMYKHVEHD